MKVKVQFGTIFNLDKCLACNTCSVSCKNVWTNRDGCDYMWWNNVETKPGIGYPKQWENQEIHRGGWEVKNGKLRLRQGGKALILASLFWNPRLPPMENYMGKSGPWTYTYEDLHTNVPMSQQPMARPKSLVTGKEDVDLDWGVNWEDQGAGINITGKLDKNFKDMSPEEHDMYLQYRDVFYFFLPRICNHCLNPACTASCPSGAAYKREEDGIVLIDQDKCRGWRYCNSGCPYKKPYFNWTAGKSEKCIFCYPRVETGQAPMCMHSCVGRIRYVGPVLYDLDRVYDAASTPDESKIIEAHRNTILDPFDDEIVAAARKDGISESWLEQAKRTPFYFFVKKWEMALPLHPEFRTLPMVWYIPPQSPSRTLIDRDTYSNPGEGLSKIDEFRIPIKYLASLLSAGVEEDVKKALKRILAMRAYRRSRNIDEKPDLSLLDEVGLTEQDANHMHRLLSLAFYNERFIIPTTHREDATEPYTEVGFLGFTKKVKRKIKHIEPLRKYPS